MVIMTNSHTYQSPTFHKEMPNTNGNFIILIEMSSQNVYLEGLITNSVQSFLDEQMNYFSNKPKSFNIITYSNSYELWQQKWCALNSSNVKNAMSWLRMQKSSNGRNLLKAIQAASTFNGSDELYVIATDLPDRPVNMKLNEMLRNILLSVDERRVNTTVCTIDENSTNQSNISDGYEQTKSFYKNLSKQTTGIYGHVFLSNMSWNMYRSISPSQTIGLSTIDGNTTTINDSAIISHNQTNLGSIGTSPILLPSANFNQSQIVQTATNVHNVGLAPPHSIAYGQPSVHNVLASIHTPTSLVKDSVVWCENSPLEIRASDMLHVAPTMNSRENYQINYVQHINSFLHGHSVLVKSTIDSFYRRGTIQSQILAHRFMVEVMMSDGPTILQDTPIYDLIHWNDGKRHDIYENDLVLVPCDGMTENTKWLPATVIRGRELRSNNTINNHYDKLVVASAVDEGTVFAVERGLAVWIPRQVFERIKHDIQLPVESSNFYRFYQPRYEIPNTHQVTMPSIQYYQWPFIVPQYQTTFNIPSYQQTVQTVQPVIAYQPQQQVPYYPVQQEERTDNYSYNREIDNNHMVGGNAANILRTNKTRRKSVDFELEQLYNKNDNVQNNYREIKDKITSCQKDLQCHMDDIQLCRQKMELRNKFENMSIDKSETFDDQSCHHRRNSMPSARYEEYDVERFSRSPVRSYSTKRTRSAHSQHCTCCCCRSSFYLHCLAQHEKLTKKEEKPSWKYSYVSGCPKRHQNDLDRRDNLQSASFNHSTSFNRNDRCHCSDNVDESIKFLLTKNKKFRRRSNNDPNSRMRPMTANLNDGKYFNGVTPIIYEPKSPSTCSPIENRSIETCYDSFANDVVDQKFHKLMKSVSNLENIRYEKEPKSVKTQTTKFINVPSIQRKQNYYNRLFESVKRIYPESSHYYRKYEQEYNKNFVKENEYRRPEKTEICIKAVLPARVTRLQADRLQRDMHRCQNLKRMEDKQTSKLRYRQLQAKERAHNYHMQLLNDNR
ncbi:hypothetical protein SNEBB_004766 [Seison nebaliae]|nr:hypothetical protein SNEBB_004766 [Seison nebaliae]